ncbi:hypothetical protein PR202_ga23623 [Eleusine coracana subsp. coracana]|uniref:KIB1-4 beta-propeller domain-containing protein n=1 Tax=Eleusine coracana subsp. coracana TaxID=191504 RepID=A0AAV5D6Q1_ELECO|nr:hypothetical protein PR202_ga23623 [Eleusine coracana subsp. coracana]
MYPSLLFPEDDDDIGLLQLRSPFTRRTRLLMSLLNVRVSHAPVELDAVLVGRDRFSKLALCSLETFSWAMSARDGWRKYEDMALFRGKLYAVTTTEDLIAFDVDVTDGGGSGGPSLRRIDLVFS